MNITLIVNIAVWAILFGGCGWLLWLLARKYRALSPNFVAAVVVLFIAAVGLNGATQYLKLHFKKLPVDIAKPVKAIPADLGPWRLVSLDEPLEHDVEDALATKEYVFRDYVNETIVGPEMIKR